MTLANNTPYRAGAAPLVDAQGRPVIVAVVKATFAADAAGEEVWVSDSGSDNGTQLCRGNTVLWIGSFRSPTRLQVGDIVRMGRHEYQLAKVSTERQADQPA